MQIFLIILLLSFIISLFTLYVIGREDVVFIRKNITLEQLFNIAFLASGVGVLSARILYIIMHPSYDYFNPLVFLLFPYFPGLSLVGGVFGGYAFLFLLSKRQKLPLARIADFFSLSFLSSLPLGFVGSMFLLGFFNLFRNVYMPVIFIALFLIFIKFFYPRLLRTELGNGVISGLFILTLSFVILVMRIAENTKGLMEFITIENVLVLCAFIIALVYIIRHEKFDVKISR